MITAVVDANALVSALLWKGTPYKLMQAASQGKFQAIVSPKILEETEGALATLGIPSEKSIEMLEAYMLFLKVSVGKSTVKASRDAKDNHVLALAIDAKADAIVSGDKDLTDLKVFGNKPIYKPRQFLDKLGT